MHNFRPRLTWYTYLLHASHASPQSSFMIPGKGYLQQSTPAAPYSSPSAAARYFHPSPRGPYSDIFSSTVTESCDLASSSKWAIPAHPLSICPPCAGVPQFFHFFSTVHIFQCLYTIQGRLCFGFFFGFAAAVPVHGVSKAKEACTDTTDFHDYRLFFFLRCPAHTDKVKAPGFNIVCRRYHPFIVSIQDVIVRQQFGHFGILRMEIVAALDHEIRHGDLDHLAAIRRNKRTL